MLQWRKTGISKYLFTKVNCSAVYISPTECSTLGIKPRLRDSQCVLFGYRIAVNAHGSRAAVVHLNFWAGSTFSVPVCTVPGSIDKVDAVRRYALNRLNLLLLKGQRSVWMYWKLDSRRRRTSMDFTEGNEFIWLHVRNSKLFWFLKRSYYWTINLRWNLHLFGVHDLEWIL